jgi:transposase InsO family protein
VYGLGSSLSEETNRMADRKSSSVHERWALLRFAVVGPLLADPPPRGELRAELERLAARQWRHPVTGEPTTFAFATIERWYLTARRAQQDPVGALRRKVRKDAGQQGSMMTAVCQALMEQYAGHPSWSVQLHYDNLVALAQTRRELGAVPSYSTVRRFMKAHGLHRRRRSTSRRTEGAERAEARLAKREVRSYEAEYIGGLWHWDFHVGSRPVVTAAGELVRPVLFGVLDDHSRVACHLQWYWSERAENTVHGLSQGFQKRGLPRAAMSDNGKAMTAAEVTAGLARLGVTHETTLPYSPYQNAKQESFWGQVEGRLLAMLEDVDDLSLRLLNEATQAWVEHEYNRELHSELGVAPLSRWRTGRDVMRPSPDSEALRLAFTRSETRRQRRSDGTVSLAGRRFEVPNRYRHLEEVTIRYAEWDLATLHLVDGRTGNVLCRLYPQDKAKNANALRRTLDPVESGLTAAPVAPQRGIAPLLQKLMAERAATGLPPAYLSKDEVEPS